MLFKIFILGIILITSKKQSTKVIMFTLQKVCGSGGTAPIVGSFTYQNDLLIGAIVHKIEVNNNSENQLPPVPDFTFDTLSATITRPGNAWVVGDKLIIWYSKCNCNC